MYGEPGLPSRDREKIGAGFGARERGGNSHVVDPGAGGVMTHRIERTDIALDRSGRICLDHGTRVRQGGGGKQRRSSVGKRSGAAMAVESVLAFLERGTWTQAALALARRVAIRAGGVS